MIYIHSGCPRQLQLVCVPRAKKRGRGMFSWLMECQISFLNDFSYVLSERKLLLFHRASFSVSLWFSLCVCSLLLLPVNSSLGTFFIFLCLWVVCECVCLFLLSLCSLSDSLSLPLKLNQFHLTHWRLKGLFGFFRSPRRRLNAYSVVRHSLMANLLFSLCLSPHVSFFTRALFSYFFSSCGLHSVQFFFPPSIRFLHQRHYWPLVSFYFFLAFLLRFNLYMCDWVSLLPSLSLFTSFSPSLFPSLLPSLRHCKCNWSRLGCWWIYLFKLAIIYSPTLTLPPTPHSHRTFASIIL